MKVSGRRPSRSLGIVAESRAKTLSLAIAVLCMVCLSPQTQARYAHVELEQVPVERLLKNLQVREKETTRANEKALLEFQIGRLHSMAYAYKTETAPVAKSEVDNSSSAFFGYGFHDYNQFRVSGATSEKQAESAKKHLTEAIAHLEKAVSLDKSLVQARLGLAWCLAESGEKSKALPLFKEVFKQSFEKEQSNQGGMRGSSVAQEAAQYLIPLLDRSKDAAEIADLEKKSAQLGKIYRAITPIVLPTMPNVERSEIMQPARVTFDLDGSGPRTYSQWPGKKSGWLVYDDKRTGKITSGLQLFGQSTFWVFWRDGYDALKALDDNHDGRLAGDELNGLAVWRDENCDGVSQPEEVVSLASLGIESLSCSGAPIDTAGADRSGITFSAGGVTFRSGKRGDSYDWIVDEWH